MANGDAATLDVLVTVKSYPAISRSRGEVVCVAGIRIRPDGRREWARLWPVAFRDLEWTRKFRLWQWVKVEAWKTSRDQRSESWAPNVDSITTGQRISTRQNWRDRLAELEPLMSPSMCAIRKLQQQRGTSLAAFRIDDLDVTTEENDPWKKGTEFWNGQGSLLMPDRAPLEWIPLRFKYQYRCEDAGCNGHSQSVVDWGVLELYRKIRREEGPVAAEVKTIQKLEEVASATKDTILIVGNQHQNPQGFLVIGLVYPPKVSQGAGDQLGFEIL